ncbi:MAG TPA: DUF1257 domain-containing protein [Anaerolineaceae bacterium]|nr:DUF1257 domain-containing protein [Anaerolineaceae bacterium]
MSHISRIKTKMVEKEYLLQALTDLGYQTEEGEESIRGFGGKQTPVEIRVPGKKIGYDIGFQRSGEAYDIVADWWGVIGVKQKEFTQQVSQRYAYHAAKAKLAAQGFNLVEEEVQETGEIHMVLRRMA